MKHKRLLVRAFGVLTMSGATFLIQPRSAAAADLICSDVCWDVCDLHQCGAGCQPTGCHAASWLECGGPALTVFSAGRN